MKKLLLTLLLATVVQSAAHAGEILTTDVVDTAANAGTFKTLIAAIKVAKLEGVFRGTGPITVFAPTDAAFAKLPPIALQNLLNNPAELRNAILGHAILGKAITLQRIGSVTETKYFGTATPKYAVQMASGSYQILRCFFYSGDDNCNARTIGGAQLLDTDIQASNGIIHVIDTVMLDSKN